ncbi:zinc ribbon domain-containing protein [Lactimicrobium massiliense]|uniref:zinc ribbon domain-containing protein n=1 Tax=Lactimicrobium massiliense TaxID=2161814 RepID=UPI000D54C686|nr:zinc ribbon domain-containing protein [Lactimicrobium massiliense]
MYCPHCGRKISSDAKFCPFCGQEIVNLDKIYNETNSSIDKEEDELDNKVDIDNLIESENEYLFNNPITDEEIENREDQITIQHFKRKSKKYKILTIFAFLFVLLSIKAKYPITIIVLETFGAFNNVLTLVIGFGLIKVKHRKLVYRTTFLIGFIFFTLAALLYTKTNA